MLLSIDGMPVSVMVSCEEVSKRLSGPVGSSVQLLLQSAGNAPSKTIEVALQRQRLSKLQQDELSLERILLLQSARYWSHLNRLHLRIWAKAVSTFLHHKRRIAAHQIYRILKEFFHALCDVLPSPRCIPLLAQQRRLRSKISFAEWRIAIRNLRFTNATKQKSLVHTRNKYSHRCLIAWNKRLRQRKLDCCREVRCSRIARFSVLSRALELWERFAKFSRKRKVEEGRLLLRTCVRAIRRFLNFWRFDITRTVFEHYKTRKEQMATVSRALDKWATYVKTTLRQKRRCLLAESRASRRILAVRLRSWVECNRDQKRLSQKAAKFFQRVQHTMSTGWRTWCRYHWWKRRAAKTIVNYQMKTLSAVSYRITRTWNQKAREERNKRWRKRLAVRFRQRRILAFSVRYWQAMTIRRRQLHQTVLEGQHKWCSGIVAAALFNWAFRSFTAHQLGRAEFLASNKMRRDTLSLPLIAWAAWVRYSAKRTRAATNVARRAYHGRSRRILVSWMAAVLIFRRRRARSVLATVRSARYITHRYWSLWVQPRSQRDSRRSHTVWAQQRFCRGLWRAMNQGVTHWRGLVQHSHKYDRELIRLQRDWNLRKKRLVLRAWKSRSSLSSRRKKSVRTLFHQRLGQIMGGWQRLSRILKYNRKFEAFSRGRYTGALRGMALDTFLRWMEVALYSRRLNILVCVLESRAAVCRFSLTFSVWSNTVERLSEKVWNAVQISSILLLSRVWRAWSSISKELEQRSQFAGLAKNRIQCTYMRRAFDVLLSWIEAQSNVLTDLRKSLTFKTFALLNIHKCFESAGIHQVVRNSEAN